jgi:predicted MPP superfamily phosphohydrolase
MSLGQYAVLAILLFGHVALWIAFFNRTHGFNLPGRCIRFIELAQIVTAVGLLYPLVRQYQASVSTESEGGAQADVFRVFVPYGLLSVGFAAWTTIHWIQRTRYHRRPPKLLSHQAELFDIAKRLDELPARGWSTRLFACLPMNEMFNLCVDVKELEIPRLPRELDGLTITHLSDLHYTGKITRPFFDHVIDHAVSLAGDLMVITGDILEEESCYEWLEPTLGRLRAPHGVYFVLGNHDRRLRDGMRLRRELSGLGFIDVGLEVHERTVFDRTVLVTGNELPWYGPPPELPPRTPREGLRLLLSHSPDQLAWAVARDVDLMLAGHTHGGHIRLPVVGPIVCPSRYGVRFAGGIFYRSPTLMHVSRGISGMDPLRFNCPPEVTKLILRSPQAWYGA